MSEAVIIALQAGVVFHERYRTVRRIKAGGMGAVYEVVDERTNSPRALKIMLPTVIGNPDLHARFALEAKVTGNIVTDHIVRVSDAGVDAPTGMPFLVMELLHGQELGSLLLNRGPLPPAEVVLYLHQTALALDKTHAAGIVHRDLKPENLFVTYRDDGSPCVKILDFGIAKVVAQSTAHGTSAIGTPIFMAPEQFRGDGTLGPRTDLFALGHIAYALLAGEPYWYGEQQVVSSVYPLLSKIMQGMPEAPRARAQRRHGVTLPEAFDRWIEKALAARAEERFERATEQVAALAEVLGVPGTRSVLPLLPTALSPAGPPAGMIGGTGRQQAGTEIPVMSRLPSPRGWSVAGVVVALAVALGILGALRSHPEATVASGGRAPVQLPRASAAIVEVAMAMPQPDVAPVITPVDTADAGAPPVGTVAATATSRAADPVQKGAAVKGGAVGAQPVQKGKRRPGYDPSKVMK